MGRLVALVGPPGCGKTTVCGQVADLARGRGLRVGGILSTGVPADPSGRRERLVVDLSTGRSRPLARRPPVNEGAGRWHLDEAALAWGAEAARRGAAGADVLIVDELGPLELDEGRGWAECVGLLRDAACTLAVAVVREECLPALRNRLGPAAGALEVVRVSPANRSMLPTRLLGDAR